MSSCLLFNLRLGLCIICVVFGLVIKKTGVNLTRKGRGLGGLGDLGLGSEMPTRIREQRGHFVAGVVLGDGRLVQGHALREALDWLF